MRLKKKKNDILKEYVNHKIDLLLEDYYDAGDVEASDPLWIHTDNRSLDSILTIFGIKGLQNAAKVAIGVGESILTKAFGEAAIFIERLWYMINPYYFAMSADELENIISQDRSALDARLDRVQAGYSNALREAQRSISAMGTDLTAIAFFANPALTLGYFGGRGAVGLGMSLFHRITRGGPSGGGAGAGSSRGSSAENNLSERTRQLESRARELEQENRTYRRTSENVLQNLSRELLGPNATPDDLRELARNSRENAASTASGAAPGAASSATATRVIPGAGTATIREQAAGRVPAQQNFNQRLMQLQRDTQVLKRDYVQFLNSPDVQNTVKNSPVVKEGQKAIVDLIMDNVRNNFRELTFDKMRNRNPEEFNQIEREQPEIFSTEQKKKAFVQFAKQQLKSPTIQQLNALAQQNPELRNEVNMAVSEVERLASR